MKNPEKAKVMYEVDGKPMVGHVVELALRLGSSRIIVIAGYQRETVVSYLRSAYPQKVEIAEQKEQLGTGHAVMQTEEALRGFTGDVIVLSGDVPLLTGAALEKLESCHRKERAVATILTAETENPTGYGRIIRSENGLVTAIVEERDATPEIRKIKEINSGIYMFRRDPLFDALHRLTPDNSQKEYYLTDVFKFFWERKLRVAAVPAGDFNEIRGVNTFEQLQETERIYKSRPVATGIS